MASEDREFDFSGTERSYAPGTRLKLASFSLNSSNNEAKLAIFLSMATLNAEFRLLVNISLERDKLSSGVKAIKLPNESAFQISVSSLY
ncbi:MAG: hypothetical protein AAFW70_21295 [Cyanobacteria bacterium J06635_10]